MFKSRKQRNIFQAVYNKVRTAGHEMGFFLGENVIGEIAFQISRLSVEEEASVSAVIAASENSVMKPDDAGSAWSSLTSCEAAKLLTVRA